MNQQEVEGALYQKYIESTKKKRNRCMGIEIEMPVVNLNEAPVDIKNCFEVADKFQKKFGFVTVGTDDNGQVYSMSHPQTEDNLSFDCSYSNLELSLGKVKNLFDAKAGLISRDQGEEKLLEPLFIRAEKLTNPAKEMLVGLENGRTMKDFILEYSRVE